MRTSPLLRLALVLGATALGSCGLFRQEAPEGPAVGRAEPATVTVTNLHWGPVTISVVGGGRSYRLGGMSTNQTETFTLPGTMASGGETVRFTVDPIGATYRYVSDPIFAGPGAEIILTIQNNLQLSTVTLR
jgi:hypothetical protein